ncbi:MAG: hypothetical protein ABIK89_16400, partial [Planctomycetota bacterium]
EAIAMTEIGMVDPASAVAVLHYVPVVVTSAELSVATFSAGEIDAVAGELPRDRGEFHPVPFIRFHKSLTTTVERLGESRNFRDVSRLMERSVFVVSAGSLVRFLDAFGFRQPQQCEKDVRE